MGKVSDRGYLSRLNPIGHSTDIRVALGRIGRGGPGDLADLVCP
jgi:hypothetical protein